MIVKNEDATFLPPRCYGSAGISYSPVSVSPSVGHKSEFYRNG